MTTVWMILVQFIWMPLYEGEIVNVALNKPVSMSSRHNSNFYGPEIAVDGDTTARPPSIIHTNGTKTPTWWWVNLQTPVQDATVKMYFRMDDRRRRNGIQFYTSLTPFSSNSYPQGQLCHSIIGTNIEDVVSVNCSGIWQYLMVYTNTINSGFDRNPVLDFGEVQVLGCNGTYGVSCDKACSSRHCAVTISSCDRNTGACVGGCQAGWMGTDCTQECSSGMYGANCIKYCGSRHCTTNSTTCDRVSGICPGGCTAGWRGTDCMEECSSGMYGAHCTKSCSSRQCATHSTTCDKVSGICPGGCTAGWRGTDCMEECSNYTYGINCVKSCSSRHCAVPSTSCDLESGDCPGGCIAGWRGTDCVEECPLGKSGVNCRSDCNSRHCAVNTSTCNRTTGECPLTAGCTPGWRGIDCSQACVVDTYGQGCNMLCEDRKCKSSSSSCDHVNGQCDDGCKPGWNGTDCLHECPSRTYGENCRRHCVNRNCLTSSETCDHVTGACIPEGCVSGWQGIDCGRPCRIEKYGKDCMENCGHCNGTCEAVDGRCLWGCQEGYHGIRCQEELPTVMTAVIAGVVGAVSMLVVIGGVLTCLLRLGGLQWLKASRSDEVKQSTEMSDVFPPSVVHQGVSDRPHSMSGHVYNNDYEVINSKTKSDKDVYEVITDETYQNL